MVTLWFSNQRSIEKARSIFQKNNIPYRYLNPPLSWLVKEDQAKLTKKLTGGWETR